MQLISTLHTGWVRFVSPQEPQEQDEQEKELRQTLVVAFASAKMDSRYPECGVRKRQKKVKMTKGKDQEAVPEVIRIDRTHRVVRVGSG